MSYLLFLSMALAFETNTCYIKWDSPEQKKLVETETGQALAIKEGYVPLKLKNEKINVGMKVSKDSTMASVGRSRLGEKYIETHKGVAGFNPDAMREIKNKDLSALLKGFEKTECEHYRKEKLSD